MKRNRFLLPLILIVMMLAHPTAQAVELSEAVIDKINSLVSTLIDEDTSAYKRAKVMHDWLIYNADYDLTYSKGEPDDILLDGTGVCQSYGLAYQQMMKASGLESLYLVSDTMNHAWNMVKLGDDWYHVDCTWDDPVSADYTSAGGYENEKHLLLTDEEIGENHYDWYIHPYYPDEYFGGNVINIDDPVKTGTLEETKAFLARQAAAGGMEQRYISCTYDGTESGFATVRDWAWSEHDGYDIHTLWHGQYDIKMEVIWHYEAPVGDGESLAKNDPDDSAVPVSLGALEEAKASLEGLAAEGGSDSHLFHVTYDGTQEQKDAILNWAWSKHDGFRVDRIWSTDEWLRLEVFWGEETEYFSFENNADYIDVGDTTTVVIKETVGSSDFVWTSSDERIAAVDQNGVVTGKKPGEAIITAESSGGASDTIRITVMPPMQADFDLTFTRTGDTSAMLTWNAIPGVTEYRVYGMAAGDNAYTLLNVTEKREASLDLDAGKQYRFYVRAVRLAGEEIIAMHRSLGAGDLPGEEQYTAVYDYNTYIEYNPDVASAFGNDHEAVLLHFLKSGMQEGRVAGDTFNVQYYRANYADLSAEFGDDMARYYTHYLQQGHAEGRTADRLLDGVYLPGTPIESREAAYAAVYSYEYYIGRYPDIAAACQGDRAAALEHFISSGMTEGRRGNAAFNVDFYRANYDDLRNAFGDDLTAYYKHFIRSGQAEGRVADRLLSSGAEEPTDGPDTPDSRERYYAPVYDYDYYVNRYADIAAAFKGDRAATLDHFINHGMREGRRGSAEFSVSAYRARYADLEEAFGSDLEAYYRHYINSGKQEGRTGK